jgi:HEAT repeat protein
MVRPRKKKNDDLLLMTLASGATVEGAARSAQISSRTAHRRLADPEFRQRLRAMQTDMVKRVTAMLTAEALAAVKTLLALLRSSTSESVRLGAAKAILALASKAREITEITERIAELEALMTQCKQEFDVPAMLRGPLPSSLPEQQNQGCSRPSTPSARPKRRKNDDVLLMALACGCTVENASRSARISPRTAHRRLADPEFCQRLQATQTDMAKRVTATLTAAASEAATGLLTLLNSTSESVRLGAAKAILELECKAREITQVIEHLAKVEARMTEWENMVEMRATLEHSGL